MVVFVLISSIRLIKYPSEIDSNLSHPSKHQLVIAVVRPWPVFVVPLINIVIYRVVRWLRSHVHQCYSLLQSELCFDNDRVYQATADNDPRAFTIDLHSIDEQLLLFTANHEIYLPITIARKSVYLLSEEMQPIKPTMNL